MKQDYVVLTVRGARRDVKVLGTAAGAGDSAEGVDVQVVRDLRLSQVREIRDAPETRCIAPVIEVQLAQPFDGADARALDTGGVTWGVRAVRAASSAFDGSGVKVAVLDTGIAASHPAFAGKELVEKDFTGEGNGDFNGHGTHCAGTLVGGVVNGLRIGVAPGVAKVFVGKVLNRNGAGTTKQFLDGVLWAVEQGANIVSMSIGFDFPALIGRLVETGVARPAATSMALEAYRDNIRLFEDLSRLVHAQEAFASKAILIAAAGNESKRPEYELGTAPPAAAEGFISVGALRAIPDQSDRFGVASFSNARPKVAAPGVDITSADRAGGLSSKSGTSMATPHVAGVAALWWQKILSEDSQARMFQLSARVMGSTRSNALLAGEVPSNAGNGLVQAP